MEIYAYQKKTKVFTKEFITNLAAANRAKRIAKYPETADFGELQAEIDKKVSKTVLNTPKITLFSKRNITK